MTTITVFNKTTGALGRVLTLPEKAIEANVPEGFGFKRGRFDNLSQRVDLATGDVVDHVQPKPDDDHEYRENVFNGRPRWVKKREVVEREVKDRLARSRLAEINVAMVRPLVDLLADPLDAKALARLGELKAEAAETRKDVVPTADEIAVAERLRGAP